MKQCSITVLMATFVAMAVSCGSSKDTPNDSIGGQKDKHECLVGAGEQWSKLQQKCVRVFDVAKRLNPLDASGSAQISAFILFNEDGSKAELFLPDAESTILESSHNYESGIYRFALSDSTVYINSVPAYKAN